MSGPSIVKETPIERRAQLVEYAASGARTPDRWKIGTEHEKFGFRLDDLRPPTYEGERGIGKMLEGLRRFDWAPAYEHDHLIALTRDDASITLEPADSSNFPAASSTRSMRRARRCTVISPK